MLCSLGYFYTLSLPRTEQLLADVNKSIVSVIERFPLLLSSIAILARTNLNWSAQMFICLDINFIVIQKYNTEMRLQIINVVVYM